LALWQAEVGLVARSDHPYIRGYVPPWGRDLTE
jgi:hypothetical protein